MNKSLLRRLGILAMTACLHIACGSDEFAQPTPTPTPVAERAFIYVLSPGTLSTFEVVPTTGLPVPVGSLAITYANHVAIDPHGRFVYVSGHDRTTWKGFVRSYVVDAGDASLRLSSERACSRPVRLVAGEGYLVVFDGWYGTSDSGAFLVAYAVGADGALSPMPTKPPSPGFGYSENSQYFWLPGVGAARDLASYVVDNWSRHSYPEPGVYTVRVAGNAIRPVGTAPIPAAIHSNDGEVRDTVSLGGQIVVADSAGRLTVLAVDPTSGSVSVRSQVAGGGTLSAAPSGDRLAVLTGESLVMYSLLANGQLAELDRLPASWDSPITFHPSGNFLYAARPNGVMAFAIGSDGKLSEFAGPFAPRGEVVVGLPPS